MARNKKQQKSKARRQGTDWSKIKDLGKVPDSKIAKRLGLTPQAVLMARHARNIPAFQKAGRPTAKAAPKPAREAPARAAGKKFEPHPSLEKVVAPVLRLFDTIVATYAARGGR